MATVCAGLVIASAGSQPATISLSAAEHPAVTAGCRSPLTVMTPEAATRWVDARTRAWRMAGDSDATVDVKLASQLCLRNIGERTDAIALASANSNIYLAANVYYDSQAKLYYSITNWHWNNDNYYDDVPGWRQCSFCRIAIGGMDGIGTSYNFGVIQLNSSVSYWPASCSPVVVSSSASAQSTYGAAFTFQDYWDDGCAPQPTAYRVDNSAFGGQEVQSFKPNWVGCKLLQAYGKYEHTWQDTGISSVSVGLTDVSFVVSSSANQWYRAVNSPSASVCG